MASPPAGSPPSSNLALPRQRPGLSLALPKNRKPSAAPSSASAHPLRQTSFPPAESLEAQHRAAEDKELNRFSPGDDDDIDNLSDTEITSAVSGPTGDGAFTGQKRKRPGEKRPRGRPSKNPSVRMGSASVVNGDDGRSTTGKSRGTAGAPSLVNGEAEDEDDDEDDGEAGVNAADGAFNAQTLEQDNQRRYLFREAVSQEHQERYDAYNRVKLRNAEVKRLVNATLSQSVPPNVIAVVQAYTKMFAGMLIEGAREVQAEWMAAYPKRPDGEDCRAYKRLKLLQQEFEDEDEEDGEQEQDADADTEGSNEKKQEETPKENGEKTPNGKPEESEDAKPVNLDGVSDSDPSRPSSSSKTQEASQTQPNGQPNGLPNGTSSSQPQSEKKSEKDDDDDSSLLQDLEHVQPGAWGLYKYIEECDRGPLLPDHLRESLRRYKKSRGGGTVGFTGISLERPEVAAPRMGGKRLFK